MSAARYTDFRQIIARFNSGAGCHALHSIKIGETIGYSRRHGTVCAACWRKWTAENAEADTYEQSIAPTHDIHAFSF